MMTQIENEDIKTESSESEDGEIEVIENETTKINVLLKVMVSSTSRKMELITLSKPLKNVMLREGLLLVEAMMNIFKYVF